MNTHDLWQVDDLDLGGYLARIGVPTRAPGRAALDELHEAHVRTFTFDDIDVFIGAPRGVDLATLQEKFVVRGRGGYCFEHSTVFAAALQQLGYEVRRHLGRVGDPADGQQGRTHMVVEAVVDGQRLLCDPGFGMSLLRPVPLEDGVEDEHLGWRYRIDRRGDVWDMRRWRDGGWMMMHSTDELEVLPSDVVIADYYTGTHPESHFKRTLMLTRHLPGRHVTLTQATVTVREAGKPTENRPLRDGELAEWLRVLEVPLTADEEELLLTRAAEETAKQAAARA
ncbi:arylamine N-acetyltransferase family protein [Yinghuangia soli]|uniref:Arylamine N-acetyltransferase n=1 Tax=Yinghuangia soli TaxID=2908204 RepID=A0AA41Q118_9ACTN|nr:arylamine N-acetyltransferase [Yinghuangia soli]MCF2528816.1 arylamine N-acetyltransferase [Yinghuangia soli]